MLVLKRIALGLLGLVVVLAIVFIILLAPKNKEATDKTDFVVASGERSAGIAQNLERLDVICQVVSRDTCARTDALGNPIRFSQFAPNVQCQALPSPDNALCQLGCCRLKPNRRKPKCILMATI